MDKATPFFLHTASRNVSWNVVCPVRLFIEKLVFWSLEPRSLSITARNRHKSLGFIMVHLVHHVSSFVKYQHPMTPFIADTAARHCTFLRFLPECHFVSHETVQLGSCPSGTPVLANLKSIATHTSAHCMLQRARKHIERWSHDMQTVMRQQHHHLGETPQCLAISSADLIIKDVMHQYTSIKKVFPFLRLKPKWNLVVILRCPMLEPDDVLVACGC